MAFLTRAREAERGGREKIEVGVSGRWSILLPEKEDRRSERRQRRRLL